MALLLSNCDASDPSVISINNNPTPNGTFRSACQTATVHTNAPGYTLAAKSSSSTLNYLNPTTISPVLTIASTSNLLSTPSTLTNNTWGFGVQDRLNFTGQTYAIDNESNTYAALPTTDTTIYTDDGSVFPLQTTDHTFYYGTKLDTNTMAGTYAATITYTAVGAEVVDPPTYPRVENGASFQDTTTNINRTCEALPIYDSTNPDPASTVIMTDSRNNQDYRVRRLQDGKCWMIDNLKLATPGAELILTPYDTNIPEGTNFTMPAIAITTVAERATNGICADEIISGTGNYLTCDGTADQSITNNTLIAYVDPSSTARCLNNTASNGDTVSYSTDSQTKCGYLYNWYTATAGTGTYGMISGDSATASICPVGWRLPNAGSGTAAMTNEFAVLNGAMAGNTNPTLTSDATTQPNWYSDGSFPATYAGYWADGFGQQGYGGLYWSVSAYSNTHAGPLNLYYSSVQPGNNKNTFKRSGLSIRCVL